MAAFAANFIYDPLLETRPYPGEGYLLVSAGLCGGGSYALLERFYRKLGVQFFHLEEKKTLYDAMNRLAAGVPRGADGLRCEPFFAGTGHQPELRASFTGISVENFTPGHVTRVLLEGMARSLHGGYERIRILIDKARNQLVGSGKTGSETGIRKDRDRGVWIAAAISSALGRSSRPALLAAVGANIFPNLNVAGRVVHSLPLADDPSAMN